MELELTEALVEMALKVGDHSKITTDGPKAVDVKTIGEAKDGASESIADRDDHGTTTGRRGEMSDLS